MALVIEQSNQAYEQRDRTQLEMAALEQANRKEDDAYHEQLSELIDELESINEQLLNSKRQMTAMVDPDEEERKEAEREEAERATEIANAEKECAQQRKERTENFEDAFHQISVATGISEVDELVKVFIKNEEQNFSLFSYLNEQAGEIERLEDEIQSLQEEKARYEEANANNIVQNDDILKIENRINTTEEQTVMYETKCETHKKTLHRVKDEIKVSINRRSIFCFVSELSVIHVPCTNTNTIVFA
jgi:coiled-coil domain-containing protein 63/114